MNIAFPQSGELILL